MDVGSFGTGREKDGKKGKKGEGDGKNGKKGGTNQNLRQSPSANMDVVCGTVVRKAT